MSRFGLLAALLLGLCLTASATSPEAWRTCLLPKKVGPGRAAIKSWFFDVTSATCTEFLFGGGQASGNNFATKKACNAVCKHVPICELPAAVGSGDIACMAYMPRFAWNATSGQCEQFIYGGCGGNKNNFQKKAQCNKACAPAPKRCSLPMSTGPCRAALPRFYFDAEAKECRQFSWGGCQGNANRFLELKGCERTCMK